MDQQEINHLIKYAMFDKEQKKKHQQSVKNLTNWHYDETEDSYTHPEGWRYQFHHLKHQKTPTGFEQEIKVYYAEEPDLAPQKGLYINERYQKLKAKECQVAFYLREGRQILPNARLRWNLSWADKGLFGLQAMSPERQAESKH
ncbi:hypothetical protein STRCR_0728 [Streptococcus criceti HS-6]|uniref:Transposase n=1 Tax=Streptococcus criceti HS-6 TaxID=873449 RepID=G5JRE1_STRCG|nr:hypothetical protein STRCR_0728 [Streptococcus criceti HS-6]